MISTPRLREAGRTGAILEQSGLPPETSTLTAQPADRYLQVCLLRLSLPGCADLEICLLRLA